MKLANLKNRTKQISVEFAGETLTITYLPSRITPELAGQEDISAALAEIIERWDLLDDDSEAYPISKETLEKLPVDFLAAVLAAIIGDAVPNVPKPKA